MSSKPHYLPRRAEIVQFFRDRPALVTPAVASEAKLTYEEVLQLQVSRTPNPYHLEALLPILIKYGYQPKKRIP